jgi:hypothetical protein
MKTKEETAKLNKLWHKNHPERVKLHFKKAGLKRYYNITVEEYDEMFNKQEGKCLICGHHQSEFKRRFDVDHNHTTSKIRGLLCWNCNLLIGHAKEDINVLKNAVKYLEDCNLFN